MLNPKQVKCLEMMFENPKMKMGEIAKELKVSNKTISEWKKNEEFKQAYDEHFRDKLKYAAKKALEKEMERRANILDKTNCRNAISYNKKNDTKMTYIVFIVDELIQVTIDTECKNKLHNIMSKCASYGIYFILASQDCTKEVIGRCKMNCSQVVGFHTFDQTDSDTLIGKGYNLQDITVKGRCKIKNSDGVNEVQTFYISEEEIEATLKPFEIARE